MSIFEELRELIERLFYGHKPASIGLIFPCFDPGGYSVNTASLALGLFILATPAYLNADGTPSLDSDGIPIPIKGPLTFQTSPTPGDVTVVVNSNGTLTLGMSKTASVGATTTINVADSSSPPLLGSIAVTAAGAVAEGVPASINFTLGTPQVIPPTG
jgi:hypothetical protein